MTRRQRDLGGRCGARVRGGLYLCVELSGWGRPLEWFVIDPPRPWSTGAFRSPILVPNPATGAIDVVVWVGAESYPYAPDFLEEARVMGISQRIPRTFPVKRLTPFRSTMILVHPKAFPMVDEETPCYYSMDIRKAGCRSDHPVHVRSSEEHCTFSLWNLSAYPECSTAGHLVDPTPGVDGNMIIHTPSVNYPMTEFLFPPTFPPDPPSAYLAGAVAAVWISHCEFIGEAVPDRVHEACGEMPVHPIEK